MNKTFHLLNICLALSFITITAGWLSVSNYMIEAQSIPNMSNSSLPKFSNSIEISGLYQDNETGLRLQFPTGWTGAELYKFMQNGSAYPKIKVSPLGVDPLTGQVKDGDPMQAVAVTVSTQNASELLPPWKQMKENIPPSVFSSATPYLDLMKWGAEKGFGCKVLSQSFTKIKEVNSLEEIMECPGDRKNVSHSFATEKYILGILFDGPTAAVDGHLEKFKTTIDSLQIDKPIDIESVIDGFDSQIKAWNITTQL